MALEEEYHADYFTIAVFGVWLFLSVLSNFGVLIVILSNKRTLSVTSVFMCNLAVSDIFLAGFVLPQSVHDFSHQEDYHEGQNSFTGMDNLVGGANIGIWFCSKIFKYLIEVQS
jgi:hypothetical protein